MKRPVVLVIEGGTRPIIEGEGWGIDGDGGTLLISGQVLG